jgi:hypothetical protein
VEHHRRGYLSAPGLTPTGADRWGREPWGPLCSGSDACCWEGEGHGVWSLRGYCCCRGERERETVGGPTPRLGAFLPPAFWEFI